MSEPQYHILIGSQQSGPIPLSRLQEMWQNGSVTPETLYWKQGQPGWEPIAKIASSLGQAPSQRLHQLLPNSAQSGPAAFSPSAAPGAQPSGVSGFAIASALCGLTGLVLGIPALFAIIFGHIARARIRRAGGALTGRPMATIGLVLGYFVLTVFAGVTAFVTLTDYFDGTDINDLRNAREIGAAVLQYADDHQGRTPASFGELMPQYIPDNTIFISPLAADKSSLGYELVLPDTDLHEIQDPAHTILIRARYTSAKGYRTTVYVDAHATTLRDEEK